MINGKTSEPFGKLRVNERTNERVNLDINEILTIKPSFKRFRAPFVMLFIFVYLAIFIPAWVFANEINFIMPAIISLCTVGVLLAVVLPTFIFDRVIICNDRLIVKWMGIFEKSLKIASIESIYGRFCGRRSASVCLYFDSGSHSIRIHADQYIDNDINKLIDKLLELNPKIDNQFGDM